MTTTDDFDPGSALVVYTPNRTTTRQARLWATEFVAQTLAEMGAIELFEGPGTNPTTLTGYASNKAWLQTDAGVTDEPGTVRVYDGSGDPTLLASWPATDWLHRLLEIDEPLLTTRGDLLTRNASTRVRLPLGAANTELRSTGLDVAWGKRDVVTPTDAQYGAVGDGVANDRAALALADAVGTTIALPAGTYLVNSNITITSPVLFSAGAVLKPASGVTITLDGGVWSMPRQIFDLSLGGKVLFGNSTRTVFAEWWGAKGDNTKTDNNIQIQQAIDALEDAPGDVVGGAVNLAGGIYLVSGHVHLSNRVSIVGSNGRDSGIKANAATWSGAAYMVLCRNHNTQLAITGISKANPCVVTVADTTGLADGEVMRIENAGGMTQVNNTDFSIDVLSGTTIRLNSYGTTTAIDSTAYTTYTSGGTITRHISQFHVRIESMFIDANDVSAITRMIYGPSWNEDCGLRNVLLQNYRGSGVRVDGNYGGSSTVVFSGCEFFGSATSPSSVGIDILAASIVNWTNFSVRDSVFVGPTAPSGTNVSNGISINGRAILSVSSVHFEHTDAGIFAAGAAQVGGTGMSGGPSVAGVIELFSNFTGSIHVHGARRGSATVMLVDGTALGYTGYTLDPANVLDYPPRFAVIRRTYTASATWTKPSGCASIKIIAVGAGGGGGGATAAASQNSPGQGGGSGAVVEKVVSDLTAIASLAVTIGTAGVGASGSSGTAGTATTVVGTGVSVSATGGTGGAVTASGTTVIQIASAATSPGTGGDFIWAPEPGVPGMRSSGTLGLSSWGGSGPYGRGAAGRQSAGNGATPSIGYGGGGGGANSYDATSYAGGDGGPGVVFIDEYY